jgi:hypothetical protein
MKKDIADYDLTMNIEQDSTGKTEYVAALYTPAVGLNQGRGTSPEAAILDLAGKIRQAQSLKSFSNRVTNALNQPVGNPFLIHEPVPETVAEGARTVNVGKIVHYMPGSDDVEQPGQVLPAIITKEWGGGKMDLQVFNNKVSGTSSRYSVEHSMSANAGTWDWPKKA